ncbi:glutaminyl-peptide cyclotransferase [Aurantiacibacter gangjinensis]|uniref:glutaminyl-peptide cyclotransferase n=1 Tax=Aurantiacibacter gangjinensis TaxID=502682 RepID=UPI0007ED01E3|nr:glutaminyl-peptide cyclotransferase [Aurantiacibacter gangjinensis]
MTTLRHLLSPLAAAALLWLPAHAQDVQPAPAAVETQAEAPRPIEIFDVEIVAEYPHDPAAFTQGLLWHYGHLYESTGREGQSQVRRVDLETGEVLAASDIPPDQFGEGLTVWQDELVSLTWMHGVVHRWTLSDLSPIESRDDFPFEGWGLTTFEDSLVFSDGTAVLRFIDPETLDVQRELVVTIEGEPLKDLNELEVIDGLIYANIWFSRVIVGIDPATGEVVRAIDLSPITERIEIVEHDAVLNGIAHDAENDRLFVTGKLWPTLFEISLVPRLAPSPDAGQEAANPE